MFDIIMVFLLLPEGLYWHKSCDMYLKVFLIKNVHYSRMRAESVLRITGIGNVH